MIIAEIYKGVPLIEGRTKIMVDTVIEKYDKCTLTEIANEFGFKTFHFFAHIVKHLIVDGQIKKKSKTPKKKVKMPLMAKNTFKNYYATGKDKARGLITNAILSTKLRGSNILTLPADAWIQEKLILTQKEGYKFTAVERDKATFQNMFHNAGNDSMLLCSILACENKSIGEVTTTATEDTYSSAILDYCGFIDSFYDEINDMLSRNLVRKGGKITITLAENHRTFNNSVHKSEYTNKFINECTTSNEVVNAKMVNNFLINNLIFNNKGYKLIEKLCYKDGAKMMLFIIERID